MKQRKTHARIDDEARRRKVDLAREIVYQKNYSVDTPAVEALLREESLVPSLVSFYEVFSITKPIPMCRIPSQNDLHHMVSTCLSCSWSILCTR
jgi:hypothetical protein